MRNKPHTNRFKRWRAAAKAANVGVETHEAGYVNKQHRKSITIGDKDFPYMVDQRVLIPYCTRDIYHRLKRGHVDIGL